MLRRFYKDTTIQIRWIWNVREVWMVIQPWSHQNPNMICWLINILTPLPRYKMEEAILQTEIENDWVSTSNEKMIRYKSKAATCKAFTMINCALFVKVKRKEKNVPNSLKQS